MRTAQQPALSPQECAAAKAEAQSMRLEYFGQRREQIRKELRRVQLVRQEQESRLQRCTRPRSKAEWDSSVFEPPHRFCVHRRVLSAGEASRSGSPADAASRAHRNPSRREREQMLMETRRLKKEREEAESEILAMVVIREGTREIVDKLDLRKGGVARSTAATRSAQVRRPPQKKPSNEMGEAALSGENCMRCSKPEGSFVQSGSASVRVSLRPKISDGGMAGRAAKAAIEYRRQCRKDLAAKTAAGHAASLPSSRFEQCPITTSAANYRGGSVKTDSPGAACSPRANGSLSRGFPPFTAREACGANSSLNGETPPADAPCRHRECLPTARARPLSVGEDNCSELDSPRRRSVQQLMVEDAAANVSREIFLSRCAGGMPRGGPQGARCAPLVMSGMRHGTGQYTHCSCESSESAIGGAATPASPSWGLNFIKHQDGRSYCWPVISRPVTTLQESDEQNRSEGNVDGPPDGCNAAQNHQEWEESPSI